MKQNIYDDPEFFAKYGQLPRSQGGLSAAGEWQAFRSLLPSVQNAKILDLGCGFGWHCRYLSEQGARAVIGVDISEKMLEKARALTNDTHIAYQRVAIEDIAFSDAEFDMIVSSLAFHYVQDFRGVCEKIFRFLKPSGQLVFSVEHPIFTSREEQNWVYDENGRILHWPVDKYLEEGIRHTSWLADDVIKYHRTFSTYMNDLLAAGFVLKKLIEPAVPNEILEKHPEYVDENRRPMFLLVSAEKPAQ